MIGGMLCQESALDTAALMAMSHAMRIRENRFRGSYLLRHVGLFSHSSEKVSSQGGEQPITRTEQGRTCTIVMDGEPYGMGGLAEFFSGIGGENRAEALLEAYFSFGADFLSALSGSFALAIWDEGSGELLLARDREGHCPLFYRTDETMFAFASEIKGLLRISPEAAVIDLPMLRAYLTAPYGGYSESRLYRDIQMIPPGFCGVWSRVGFSLFPYDREPISPMNRILEPLVTPRMYCPEEDEWKKILTDILFAFDYPQFDYLMPGVLQILSQEKKQKSTVALADGALHMGIAYAEERAERLGAICGISVKSIPPESFSVRQKDLKKMDKVCRALLEEADKSLLAFLFEADWQERVAKENNLEKRIRMQGILYQSALWWEHYRLARGEC